MPISIRRFHPFAIAGLLAFAACEKQPPAPTPDASGSANTAAASSTGAGTAAEYLAVHDALPDSIRKAEAGQGAGLKSTLEQNAALMQRLLEATRRPECDWGVDYAQGMNTMMPHLGKVRALARAMRADAERAIAAGDLDGGAQRVAGVFRLAKHASKNGHAVIEWLVGAGVADIGVTLVRDHPDLSKAAWKTDVQTAIREITPNDPLGARGVLKGDREMTVGGLRSGKVGDASSMGGRNWTAMPQGERDQVATALDGFWQRALEAWDSHDAGTRLRAIQDEAKATPAGELMPPLDKMYQTMTKLRDGANEAALLIAK